MTIALFTGIGVSAFAAGETKTGSCGYNVTYTLKDGVLTISGNGEISSGAVTSETSDAGGIVGGLCTDSRKHVICGNKNSGEINGVKSV